MKKALLFALALALPLTQAVRADNTNPKSKKKPVQTTSAQAQTNGRPAVQTVQRGAPQLHRAPVTSMRSATRENDQLLSAFGDKRTRSISASRHYGRSNNYANVRE